ncbi:MAG: zinc-finger domain-containing protein [Alphaproteobacteria bacterium]
MTDAAKNAPEVIEVDGHKVACDGGGGPLGHPKVFLEMGDDNEVPCPYCGRLFKNTGTGH